MAQPTRHPSIALIPGSRDITRSAPVASTNPRHFTPAFDVVHELAENKHDYVGDNWIALLSFPGFIRTCLDRIRVLVEPRPGLSPTICCCIQGGIQVVSAHEDVLALLALKRSIDSISNDKAEAEDVDEICGWFRKFQLGVGDQAMTGGARQNVQVTMGVKGKLFEMAGELGVSNSALALVLMMVTLSTQEDMLHQHRDYLNATVTKFYRRVRTRRRVAEALLETL